MNVEIKSFRFVMSDGPRKEICNVLLLDLVNDRAFFWLLCSQRFIILRLWCTLECFVYEIFILECVI